MPPENVSTSSPPDAVTGATPRPGFHPPRRRSRWRWRLRWGRPLPWPTRVELLATLGLWLLGSLGWERWQANRSALTPLTPLTPLSRPTLVSNELSRPLVTDAKPDKDGFYTYRNDRLEVRVPVALRLASRNEERPELTRARGQRSALKIELNRVFDFRARFADPADLAHDFAAQICRATGAELLNAEDEARTVNHQPAVHTVIHTRLPDGRPLTIEGLTVDEGAIAWSLWAGYLEKDERAAAAVRESFASATLRPLAGGSSDPAKERLSANF